MDHHVFKNAQLKFWWQGDQKKVLVSQLVYNDIADNIWWWTDVDVSPFLTYQPHEPVEL